jgi:hypothetical protein
MYWRRFPTVVVVGGLLTHNLSTRRDRQAAKRNAAPNKPMDYFISKDLWKITELGQRTTFSAGCL